MIPTDFLLAPTSPAYSKYPRGSIMVAVYNAYATPFLPTVIVKALVVLACGCLFAAAVAPPQPPVKKAAKVYKGQPFEYVVRMITYMALVRMGTHLVHSILTINAQTAVTAAFFCAAATILLSTASPHLHTYMMPYVCPAGSQVVRLVLGYTPRFLTGAASVFVGALLRLSAKHTLGTFFTYEVAIIKGHTLVKNGPYAWVRHPGYTGMIVVIAGVQLMHFGNGGYVTECGLAKSPVGFLLYLWYSLALFVVVSLCWRTRAEDAALSKHFGAAWEDYRARVPHALIPLLL